MVKPEYCAAKRLENLTTIQTKEDVGLHRQEDWFSFFLKHGTMPQQILLQEGWIENEFYRKYVSG